ncbi:MAG TPA: NADP-dependent oxidoreductase, partial [Acidimicrobiales bacterium]|nr:NADP-dependent oxidoreductase [Acidimicrobiales bacterium]
AIPRFGPPEVLTVAEVPEPRPGDGEVRVRVAAATVNPTDLVLRAGHRAAHLPPSPPWVPGMELAGTVDAVGPGVPWQPGDQVVAIVLPTGPRGGAQAEYVVVPAASVAHTPNKASLAEAATLPMNGLTVRRALDLLGLAPGQVLAVTGAAGAVGGYAVELGAAEGLRVLAVAGREDAELVGQLGADAVVTRGVDAAKDLRRIAPDGVDGLIDAALLGPAILPAIRDGGRLIALRPFRGETERAIDIQVVGVHDYAGNQAALQALSDRASRGGLTLRVADTLPPERAAEAHRRLEAGGVRGRLVIAF